MPPTPKSIPQAFNYKLNHPNPRTLSILVKQKTVIQEPPWKPCVSTAALLAPGPGDPW